MSEKIRDDLMADLQRIAMRPANPAPSPSPVVEVSEETTFTGRITANVTEEMVIAAINAYDNDDGDGKNAFEAMRAALVAALRVR